MLDEALRAAAVAQRAALSAGARHNVGAVRSCVPKYRKRVRSEGNNNREGLGRDAYALVQKRKWNGDSRERRPFSTPRIKSCARGLSPHESPVGKRKSFSRLFRVHTQDDTLKAERQNCGSWWGPSVQPVQLQGCSERQVTAPLAKL